MPRRAVCAGGAGQPASVPQDRQDWAGFGLGFGVLPCDEVATKVT
jgi:hypothetical protein